MLGSAVSDVSYLASARGSSQRGLTKLCARVLEREWRTVADVADNIRLTECGGREAQWVARCPTRPEFCMKSHLWRVAVLVRLALPLPHLRVPQKGCECHVRFDAAVSTRRRRRRRPKPVDQFGEHDQRCSLTRTLYRHDEVQELGLRRLLVENGVGVSTSKTSELRRPGESGKRKGDLSAIGLFSEGKTVLDIGITHPTIDTYINQSSSEAARGSAANIYAKSKDKSAHKVIKDKNLDIEFRAITFTTYGGFGTAAHALIKKMTAEAYPYDFDPWMRPGPTTRAYLQLGFALARANARMLLHADSSRRSSQNRVRTSRLRSPIGS